MGEVLPLINALDEGKQGEKLVIRFSMCKTLVSACSKRIRAKQTPAGSQTPRQEGVVPHAIAHDHALRSSFSRGNHSKRAAIQPQAPRRNGVMSASFVMVAVGLLVSCEAVWSLT